MASTAPIEQEEEQVTKSVQPIAGWPAEASETEPVPEWHRREERIFFGFVFAALLVFVGAAAALWWVLIR